MVVGRSVDRSRSPRRGGARLAWAALAVGAAMALSAGARAEDVPPAPGAGPAATPPAGAPAVPAPAPAPPPKPGPAAPKPPPPPTPEQAADAVLAAVAAKDDATLKALAGRDDPDPWLVADELVRRGQHDAAEAFAKAAPRVDTEALPAYVASRRGKPDDPARRERLARAEATLLGGRAAEALETLGVGEADPSDDFVGVRLATWRAAALFALTRLPEATEVLSHVADAAQRLGWLRAAAWAQGQRGFAATRLADYELAQDTFSRQAELCARRGDAAGQARALMSLGSVLDLRGDSKASLEALERAHAVSTVVGDRQTTAGALNGIGNAHQRLGDLARATVAHEGALAEYEALGDAAGAATVMGNLGNDHAMAGDLERALASYARALDAMERSGDRLGALRVLIGIGVVHDRRGEFVKSLEVLERVRALGAAAGERDIAASALNGIGSAHQRLGDLAKAIAAHEGALAEYEAVGNAEGLAVVVQNLGNDHLISGDYDRALAAYERAYDALARMGARGSLARVLVSLGHVHDRRGDFASSLEVMERARAMSVAVGDRHAAALASLGVGNAHWSLGDLVKATAAYEGALADFESLGDAASVATALGNLGSVHAISGHHRVALSFFERALAGHHATGHRDGAARTTGQIGGVHLRLGNASRAIEFARRAVEALSLSVRGLSAEEGSGARDPLSFVFDVGARAAVAAKDVGELTYFLESGRAGALLEGLASREVLGSAAIPESLRAEEAKARAAETRASAALRKALDGGDLAATKARRAELEAAQEQVSAVVARIQREAKAGAAVVYPKAASLDELRATLEAGDALVLYALLEGGGAALVVTTDATRIVTLGPRAPIDAAAEAAAEALADDASDTTGALSALADLVAKPLALPATTKRVLVSPTGALSYLPFAALLPDRTVAYVPSGTTYRLLREEEALRGEGVLALGDPDYSTKIDERALAVHRGATGKLVRLPATRDEALAVGTEPPLLGADATEARLRETLAKRKRWRAVHLACHGLVDTERPTLSSLAITPSGDDDGFLSCLDVFRMKVPADLVVLSACETGKGKVVKSEGIVGLTRAFMFAGSPRVLCSLWKVDDEATRALMTKFYELWNPKTGSTGAGTAEALRQAQEFVRSQEKWKHPYYWAAWVLWGLPS